MRFKDKVAIVTGGGTGIGKACALRFAREGAKVLIAGLDSPPIQEVANQINAEGGSCVGIRADVRIVEDTKRIVKETIAAFGSLHILVNNAATVTLDKRVDDLTVEEWDGVLNATLRSVFLLSKWAAPEMRRAGEGAIINIGSVGAIMPWPEGASYCSAKAGVLALTKVLALEYAASNIRVNCVSPGSILTAHMKDIIDRLHNLETFTSRNVYRRIGQPEEIANVVAFLASTEASFMAGANVMVDGAYVTASAQL
jgi:NAD(P)-dependent dehydrogenase (short-subunit alcohol dehydrogenase family)